MNKPLPDDDDSLDYEIRLKRAELSLKGRLEMLANKWDSADYAIEQVNNPLLPQEQCAIELREVIKFYLVAA